MIRRRPVQMLLLGAVLFLLASALPPAVISQLRPLDVGQSLTFVTRPADTLSLVTPLSRQRGVPAEHRDRPECSGGGAFPESPYSCFVVDTRSHQVTALTTSEGPSSKEVTIDVIRQVRFGEEVTFEAEDVVVVDARSTFPVPEPVSQLRKSVPGLASGMATDPFVREGLQYFFPFPTARQSYPFYDMRAGDHLWLDYVGETTRGGVDTYEFHHRISGLELDRNANNAINLSEGSTSMLEELAATLGTPHYAVDRTVWVEPESGTVIDTRVEAHLYFAPDATAGAERSFAPSADYTVFHTVSEWDDATRDRQVDTATGTLTTLRGLQVFAVVGKTLALAAVLAGVVLLLRERRVSREP